MKILFYQKEKLLNQELKKALDDKDIVNVANSAAKKYVNILSKDEIQDCIMNGVWYSLQRFDESRGVKFTTFVHKGVVIQCQKRIKFNTRQRSLDLIPECTKCSSDFRLKIEMQDEVDNCEDQSIIYDRFYKNMTLDEMAKVRHVTPQTIRNKISKNISQIRNRFLK